MVLTDDQKLYFLLKELRDHGMSRHQKYIHVALGFNYRMTNMQAALGLAQLERLNQILDKRQRQDNQRSFFREAEKPFDEDGQERRAGE